MDRLKKMYEQQNAFISLMQKHRSHPEVPLDITEKKSQQFLRMLAYECMGELFESNILLKNSKYHRATEVTEFDRDAYVEELCDVLHYFFGIVICSGISSDELFDTYMSKGKINVERILGGY
ncbi:hypothetical protein CMI47_18790 [Candidatus Pacearchaeota archaeon]|nr:hypothetical protein [Candidatus Pacearchaeota archaeon]